MLTFSELERAAAVLRGIATGSRLRAAVQPDREQVVLTLEGAPDGEAPARVHLVLCASPRSARVGMREAAVKGMDAPPDFVEYLRAHLVGGRVASVSLLDGDRQLAIELACAEGSFTLLLAIFGRRSNLYVLDAGGRIAAALRPLAETRSELAEGDAWRSPASPPRRDGGDRFAEVGDADLLSEIERSYAGAERRDAQAELARRIEQALRREAKSLDRKLDKVARELAAAEADAVEGDRAAVRTLTRGGARQQALKAARATVASLEAALAAAASDPDALAALAARPEVASLVSDRAPRPAPAPREREGARSLHLAGRDVPTSLAPRRYRTESGLEVWVGRSDAANDFLSTRLAQGEDLFFHLDGAPGSHVILRTDGRDDPPSEAVLDACELAVHFSKQKNASRADVHVVPVRNVKKPKGAKPGLVMVHGGRSIHLRRSPARLERILAARIAD